MELGEICYWTGASGIGVLSHECLHATLFYLAVRRIKFLGSLVEPYGQRKAVLNGVEEYACWILGNLVAQVVRKGYACGWFK